MRTIYLEKQIPKALLTKALRPLWPDVVFSPLSPTRFVVLPEAPLPDPRWVRVRNLLCGICGSDLHLLNVEADPRAAPIALPGTQRRYLGHEVVGVVTEVGPAVTRVKVGDRVVMESEGATCLTMEIEPPCRHCAAGNSTLCENGSEGGGYQRMGGGWGDGYTAHEIEVFCVPDALDDETAMLIEPLAVGVRTALRRLPKQGERALVVGSGMIGLAVIAALRALSPACSIVAMARYPHQAAMARRSGADEIIGREDPYVAVARITGGKLYAGMFDNRMIMGGFDVVFDCVGSSRTVQDSLRWARAGGTVVLAGVSLEPIKADLTPIWYQEVDLIGVMAHGTEEWDGARRSTFDLTADLLLDGRISTEGFITHRFPLSQWRAAVRIASNKRRGSIKVALDCSS